jgi:MoxR-like ATPase
MPVITEVKEKVDKIIENVEKVIVGKTEEVRTVLAALLSEGHVLVEDVPGVGKTVLARAVAISTGCGFSRIQFTPDLLPLDIIGVNVFNQKTRDFEFKRGPIHSQIILADEINRATPKTQSALLECMEERQATVDGITYPMARPFLVIATQNPIEYEGTYPLPESQMDRFFIRVKMGYPDEEAEGRILSMQKLHHPIEDLKPVMTVEEVLELQKRTREVFVEDTLRQYIVKLVQRTRQDENLFLGASPRGSISLFKAAQAEAVISGREFVIPDDIKKMAPLTLSHRIIGKIEERNFSGMDKVIEEILAEIPVPQ